MMLMRESAPRASCLRGGDDGGPWKVNQEPPQREYVPLDELRTVLEAMDSVLVTLREMQVANEARIRRITQIAEGLRSGWIAEGSGPGAVVGPCVSAQDPAEVHRK